MPLRWDFPGPPSLILSGSSVLRPVKHSSNNKRRYKVPLSRETIAGDFVSREDKRAKHSCLKVKPMDYLNPDVINKLHPFARAEFYNARHNLLMIHQRLEEASRYQDAGGNTRFVRRELYLIRREFIDRKHILFTILIQRYARWACRCLVQSRKFLSWIRPQPYYGSRQKKRCDSHHPRTSKPQ